MVAHGKRGTMRLRLTIPVLAAMAALIGTGCTSAPSAPGAAAGGTIPLLVAGDTASVTTLDAAKYGPAWAYGAMESLLTTSPGGTVEPWLAQSVSAPNPTTYVFHLRQGVRFWDGNEMTSADVVNALQYYSRPGSILTAWYPAIKSITADGPFTAVVTLQRPDAAFLAGLTYGSPIFEKKFQDERSGFAITNKFSIVYNFEQPWELYITRKTS